MVKEIRASLMAYKCETCNKIYGDSGRVVSKLTNPKTSEEEIQQLIKKAREDAEFCEKLPFDGYKFNVGDEVVETEGTAKNEVLKVTRKYRLPGENKHYNVYDLGWLCGVDEPYLRKATKEDLKTLKISI